MKKAVHCLEPERLESFLERRRRDELGEDGLNIETNLAENLVEVLNRANEFVPSDAGSILLDDPTMKEDVLERNYLTFIAAFGDKSEVLVGREIPATEGIAGHVYRLGEPYFTGDAHQDQLFHAGIDKATQFQTRALVAIPIRLGDAVCGVLELIRDKAYSASECELLAIFAGYLSVSIQNMLDARSAQALAKRDNLTNLYNDRYLHIALDEALTECQEQDKDLAVVFIDLDNFKTVNDTHGHLAGSQVLREVGHLLARVTHDVPGWACRYGGDEFAIILPGHDVDAAIHLSEEIREVIFGATFCDQPGAIQPEALHLRGLTASVGVATLRSHVSDDNLARAKTTLLHLADSAMYVAKETGRNRTIVAGIPVGTALGKASPTPARQVAIDPGSGEILSLSRPKA